MSDLMVSAGSTYLHPVLLSKASASINKQPLVITYEDAVEALHKAVIDKGEDHTYEYPMGTDVGCMYFDAQQEPSCIVGWVLAYLGLPSFSVDQTVNRSPVKALIDSEVIKMADARSQYIEDSETYQLLRRTQQYQDKGVPWGQAVQWGIDGSGNHGLDIDGHWH